MLHLINNLIDRDILTSDKQDGKILDVWMDETTYRLKYLHLRMGSWLLGEETVLSVQELVDSDAESEPLHLTVTAEKVEQSPRIDGPMPISEEAELRLAEYWQWSPGRTQQPLPPAIASSMVTEASEKGKSATERETRSFLRSLKEIRGYHMDAHDQEFGHVEDIVFDDDDWTVCFFLVDTRNWLPGRTVLIPVNRVTDIHWASGCITIEADRQTIRSSPVYDGKNLSAELAEQTKSHFAESASKQ